MNATIAFVVAVVLLLVLIRKWVFHDGTGSVWIGTGWTGSGCDGDGDGGGDGGGD